MALLVLCVAFCPARAEESVAREGLILARAVWEDPGAQADFETARQQSYTPYQGVLSRGYSASALWVRLTVAPSELPVVLRATPAWIDHLSLYDSLDPLSPVSLGDRHPASQSAMPGIGHAFKLKPSDQPREIWLRMETTSAQFLALTALPLEEAALAGSRQIVWASLYAAVLLLILLVLGTIWWVQKDRVQGAYLLRHLAYTYYGSAYLGLPTLLLSDWLPPAFFDWAFSFSATVVVPLGLLFDVLFLSTHRPPQLLMRLLRACLVISLLATGLVLSGEVRLGLQFNVGFLLVLVSLVTLAAFMSSKDPDAEHLVPRKVMLVYYSVISISLVLGLVNILGWVAVQEWTPHTLILHGLVSGVMMAVILLLRAQRMSVQNKEISWKLDQARGDMQREQALRREQSQFLHMLMHELKTPLSIVALALGTTEGAYRNTRQVRRAVHDMKTIIDRCVIADKLERLTENKNWEEVALPGLIQRVSDEVLRLAGRLQLVGSRQVPVLVTDALLLKVILSNLLENAARYSPPDSAVQLGLQPQERAGRPGVRLTVINEPGPAGWPDPQQVFAKYYRSKGAQRESGSGLGLYLAQQLALSLGGELTYAPTEHLIGFELWLPVWPKDAEEDAAGAS